MADLSISQVREKFPQYNDLSDEQLAQGLHKKYYSDMPFDAFSQKIGLKSASAKQEPSYDPMGGFTGFTQAALPGPSKEVREFERREGPLGYAKEFGKGTAGLIVGSIPELLNIPSTMTSLASSGLEKLREKAMASNLESGTLSALEKNERLKSIDLQKMVIPRIPYGVSEMTEKMFGKPTSEIAGGMRPSGEVLGLPGIPSIASGAMKTLAGTAGALRKTAGAAKSLRPEKAIESAFGEASSVSAVGEKAEKQISKKLEDLVNTRRKEFKSVKDNYLNAGRQNEEAILDNYLSKINEHYAVNASIMSPEEIKLLKESIARLGERPVEITGKVSETVRPGFEALEKERRFLDDVTRGVKVEGAAAIPAQFAKDLSKMLEGSISQYVPKEFENFNTVYRTLSEPINQYGAALGQQVTKRAGEFLPDIPKIDPAKIPNAFFSSRRSINDLKALTGDEKFVNDLAREHVATEIRGVDKAEKIRNYVAKNYDWLQELPALRSELEALAGNLRNAERLKTGAKIGAGAYLGSAALNKTTKLFGD